MKHLLITTALVALTAAPLHAASDTDMDAAAKSEATFMAHEGHYDLSSLMGARVYITNPEAEATDTVDLTEPHDSWEDIGEIGEAFLTEEGDLATIIVDVGGFLGLGERHVAVSPDELEFKMDADDEGDYFVVYTGPRSDLEDKDEYDQASYESEGVVSARSRLATSPESDSMAATDDAANVNADEGVAEETAANDTASESTDTTAEAEVTSESTDMTTESTDMAAEETDATTGSNEMAAESNDAVTDFDGKVASLTSEDVDKLTAEDLQGIDVYDARTEHVGEISELILTDDGKIADVIVDVGGFLGIGEKPVALSFDKLDIVRFNDNSGLAVKTTVTEDELEAMEDWEG